MPRIISFGNPVLIRPYAERPELDFYFKCGAGHTLIEANNGVGKSSIVIEPFMRLFDFKFRAEGQGNKVGRLTVAEMLAEKSCRYSYSFFVDFALDHDSLRPANKDFLMAGFLVDGARIDPQRPSENGAGLRFLIPHSGEIYTDPALRGMPPYEALGIRFHKTTPEGEQILGMEDVKSQVAAMRGKYGGDVYVRNIQSLSESDWRSRVGEALGGVDIDFLISLQEPVAFAEGGATLVSKNEREITDSILVGPPSQPFP